MIFIREREVDREGERDSYTVERRWSCGEKLAKGPICRSLFAGVGEERAKQICIGKEKDYN